MKVAFFSTTLNHHQLPFCLELEKLLGQGNFTFVSSKPLTEERKALGFPDFNNEYDFVIKTYLNNESYEKSLEIAINYDVVIFGSAPDFFFNSRIKKNLLTFRYQERIFKNSRFNILKPWTLKKIFCNHTRFLFKKNYMLCASAYTAGDYRLGGAYLNKCFKWGYFPTLDKFDIKSTIDRKKNRKIELLWVGRFINFKHPDAAVFVAEFLHLKGYDFHLKMIGTGELKSDIIRMINDKNLNNYITILESIPYHLIRDHMKNSHIFLFTSDRVEGWGVVLNEAMNSGCAVVANYQIGSVPYLIKNGYNGLVYNGNYKHLCLEVEKLFLDESLRNTLSENAYDTILTEWNHIVASKKLIQLIEELMKKGNTKVFSKGVLSLDKGNL